MRAIYCALIAASTLAVTPAIAKDRLGYVAIEAGDYAGAERIIDAQRRISPDMPELLINLATVYVRTGRGSQAQDLYRRVLRQPEIVLTTAWGADASSYALARAGLGRLMLVSN